jgi:hypothetical protein
VSIALDISCSVATQVNSSEWYLSVVSLQASKIHGVALLITTCPCRAVNFFQLYNTPEWNTTKYAVQSFHTLTNTAQQHKCGWYWGIVYYFVYRHDLELMLFEFFWHYWLDGKETVWEHVTTCLKNVLNKKDVNLYVAVYYFRISLECAKNRSGERFVSFRAGKCYCCMQCHMLFRKVWDVVSVRHSAHTLILLHCLFPDSFCSALKI